MHHSITDGHSMIKICSFYVDLLNDVVQSKDSIHDQLGVLSNGEKTEWMLMEATDYLNDNPGLLDKIRDTVRSPHLPLILKLKPYYSPDDEEIKTLSISHRFDTETTEQLIRKCKTERVTVNSAFAAAINTALILLAKDYYKAGKVDESIFNDENNEADNKNGIYSYKIKGEHYVNIRRFWDGTNSDQLGCHLTVATLPIKTGTDVLSDFWGYARHVHAQLRENLKNKVPLLTEAALWKSEPDGLMMEDFVDNLEKPTCSYRMTNLGEVTKQFPEHTNPVQASYLSRSTSIHGKNTICMHGISTFRDRLLYNLDFSTRFIDQELAEQIVSKIIAVIATQKS